MRVYPDRAWLDAAIPVLRAFSEMMKLYAGDRIVEHPKYQKYNMRYGPDAKPKVPRAPKAPSASSSAETTETDPVSLETAWLGDSFF